MKRFLVIAGALLVMVLAWLTQSRPSRENAPSPTSSPSITPLRNARRAPNSGAKNPFAGVPSDATGQAQKSSREEAVKLSQQEIEAYLARYGTNVDTLLAAAGVAEDRAYYLRMAATNFPNDPAVQFYIVNLKVFPEQKREWLDRLKASAPDNAMADYLSAADYLHGGNKEAALKDFEAAANKAGFSDYSLDSAQRAEEILLASGKSAGEAKVLAMEGTLLPALAGLKELSRGMAEIMKDYATAGETETANNLAEMNYRLGHRLSSGEGGKFLIHQLVGFALERITLSQLDPAGHYDFLGSQTPAQRIDELQAERGRIRTLTAEFHEPEDTSQFNDPDWISYFDRVKIYGERSAMEWLQRRRGIKNVDGLR